VIDDDVHIDLDAPGMGFADKPGKVGIGAEMGSTRVKSVIQ
jgi:hypothetical protein